MANLFEKPIAANPMSEFVALPMQFIDQAVQRRQMQYDKAKAEVEAQEDSLLQLKYLPGDAQRHHELQAKYEDEINAIIENAGGDYSTVGASLDVLTRRLKRDMNFGELGAQSAAYTAAMKFKEVEDKRLSEGKSSQEGYNMAMQSINKHTTSPTEHGTFSTFSGYRPSTIVNPYKFAQDSADEINDQYDQQGQKFISGDLIANNIGGLAATSSDFRKALMEKGLSLEGLTSQVISDKEYYQIKAESEAASASGGGNLGMMLKDIQQPLDRQGNFTYTGGSSPWLKNIAAWAGTNSWKESQDWINSDEGKRVIDNIERATATKIPKDAADASAWLLEHSKQAVKGNVITRPATARERAVVNSKGQLQNPNAAIRHAKTGKLLDADEIRDLMGSEKDANGTLKQPFVSGVVTQGRGHVPGTISITTAKGEILLMEPYDIETLKAPQYNTQLINSASHYNTGETNVTLYGNVGVIIPDTYEVRYSRKHNTYNLYKGGKLMYTKGTNADGSVGVIDHTKKDN